jgi:CheY-like chemotaxis protein
MLVPPERPDEVPEILEKMRRGDKVEHYKTVRVTRDGRRLDISLTVSPIKDAQDNVVGGSAIARDITEREEAERRLREAETLYRTLGDYPTFRQALASLLSHEPDLEVVAQAGSLAQAREMLDRRLDVAVLDLGLPDGDGSELIGELRRRNPGISVLVLSAAMGSGHLDDAVKARADAVLDKVASIPTIAEEVRRLAGG